MKNQFANNLQSQKLNDNLLNSLTSLIFPAVILTTGFFIGRKTNWIKKVKRGKK